jgi:hypothetical protein
MKWNTELLLLVVTAATSAVWGCNVAAGVGVDSAGDSGVGADADADGDTDTDTDTDSDTDSDSDTGSMSDPHYLWHTFYGGGSDDAGNSVAVDSSGNIYVTGLSTLSWDGPGGESPLHAYSGSMDVFVMKLDSNGAYQWHTFYGESSGSTGGHSIAINDDGNLYVTGGSTAPWTGPSGESPLHAFPSAPDDFTQHVFILSLGSDGAYRWHSFYGAASSEWGTSIRTDDSGGIFISGLSADSWTGPSGESPLREMEGAWGFFLLKLTLSGEYQWHTFCGYSSYISDCQLAIDGDGDIYITGNTDAPYTGPDGEGPLHAGSGGFELFVVKLGSNGVYQWHTFYGSSGEDVGLSIAVDGSNDVYVSGKSENAWNGPGGEIPLHEHSGLRDLVVLKLSPTGAYLWHTFYGAVDSEEYFYTTALDSGGSVYVVGSSDGSWDGSSGANPLHSYSGHGYDASALKLSSAGAYLWHTFYGGEGNDGASSAVAGGDGSIYVVGGAGITWNGPSGQSPLHAHDGSFWEIEEGTVYYEDAFILKLAQ